MLMMYKMSNVFFYCSHPQKEKRKRKEKKKRTAAIHMWSLSEEVMHPYSLPQASTVEPPL